MNKFCKDGFVHTVKTNTTHSSWFVIEVCFVCSEKVSVKKVMLVSSHRTGRVYALKPFYSYLIRMPARVLTSHLEFLTASWEQTGGAARTPLDLTSHDEKIHEDVTQSLAFLLTHLLLITLSPRLLSSHFILMSTKSVPLKRLLYIKS